MRFLLLFVLLLLPAERASCADDLGPVNDQVVDTIAFGSCAKEEKPQAVWDAVIAQQPDMFLFIGDNVYVDRPDDPESAGDIAEAYRVLGKQPGFRRLRATCPVLATWDDHDYGLNDAGKEFPLKRQSQTLLLSFFNEPPKSPRWSRDGVYGSWLFGPEGRRVQVVLLDTRFFRDPLKSVDGWKNGDPIGPYRPHGAADGGTLIGEPQWTWLEDQLRKPADVRIIASSIQVVASEHGWEGWCNFPAEQQRLYDLIRQTGAGGVVFVSGDRHLIEISRNAGPGTPYPMWDFTSSGMTDPTREFSEPNRYRVGPVLKRTNFGVIRIDWSAGPKLQFEGRGEFGQVLMQQSVALPSLQP